MNTAHLLPERKKDVIVPLLSQYVELSILSTVNKQFNYFSENLKL